MWLHGLIAVLVTPFGAGGQVDEFSLDRLVDFYLHHGAQGLVVLSVMGEGPALTGDERIAVLRRVVGRVGARVPVIAGVNEGTLAAQTMARRFVDQGAAALLVCTPAAMRSQHDQIAEHYRALARAAQIPLVMLDYPRIVGDLPIPFIERLVTGNEQICAIKVEASPTPDKIAGLRAVLGDRLCPLGASGGLHCVPELEAGAAGLMTGYAYPEQLVEIIARSRAGKHAEARAEYERCYPDLAREHEHGLAFRKQVLLRRGVIASATLRGAGASPARAPLLRRPSALALAPTQQPLPAEGQQQQQQRDPSVP